MSKIDVSSRAANAGVSINKHAGSEAKNIYNKSLAELDRINVAVHLGLA